VTRRKATGGPSSQPPAPSGNDLDAAAQDADIGLPCSLFETALPRKTTLDSCSCQFLTSTGLPCRHILRLLDVQQQSLPLKLLHVRWHVLDPAQLLVLKEALLKRRPARAGGGVTPTLTRDDRFGLVVAAARGVADVAASSEASFRLCLDGLAALKITLLRPRDGGGDAGGGAEGERCRACWGFGHRRTNSACPQFKKGALPKPGSIGRSGRKRAPGAALSDAESSGSSASDSGDNDTICHKCSQPGDLLCCSTCPRSWHVSCLPEDAMAPGGEEDDWSCPVCTRSAAPVGHVGNPPSRRARGGQRQKRIRAAHEASKGEKRAQKAAARAAAPAGAPARYR